MLDLTKLTISELNERIERPEKFTVSFSKNPTDIGHVKATAIREKLRRQDARIQALVERQKQNAVYDAPSINTATATAAAAMAESAGKQIVGIFKKVIPVSEMHKILTAPGADWGGGIVDDQDYIDYHQAAMAAALAIPPSKLGVKPEKPAPAPPEPAILNLEAKRSIRLE